MLSDYDGDPSALAKEVGSVDGPIPVLITRNLIPFPGVMTPILIGRQPSLKLLDYLRDHPDQTFAVFAQKDASVDYPIQEDLFEVGVYAKLVKEFEVPGSNNEHSAIVIASARCRLKSLDDANNFFTAETEMIPEVFPAEDDKEFAAAVEGLRQGVEIYVKMNDDIPNEAMVALQNISNHLSIVNFVASNIVSNIYDKIMLLEEDNMKGLRKAFFLSSLLSSDSPLSPSSSRMFLICWWRKYSFCCSSMSARVLFWMLFLMCKNWVSRLRTFNNLNSRSFMLSSSSSMILS